MELLRLLSSSDPRNFVRLPEKTQNSKVKEVLEHYVPLSKEDETRIWRHQRRISDDVEAPLPDDERVEDAGLTLDTSELPLFAQEYQTENLGQPKFL